MNKWASGDKIPPEAHLFSVCGWFCGQVGKAQLWGQKNMRKSCENRRFRDKTAVFVVDDTGLEPVTSRTSSDLGTFF